MHISLEQQKKSLVDAEFLREEFLQYLLSEQISNGPPPNLLGIESVFDLQRGTSVVILNSGGLDSATLLVLSRRLGLKPHALQFTHGNETDFDISMVEELARKYAVTNSTIPYPKRELSPSATSMQLLELYSVYLSIAAAEARTMGATHVLAGLIYEDWTRGTTNGASPEIVLSMNKVIAAECASGLPIFMAPFSYSSKASVAALSLMLGLPESSTKSCDSQNLSEACRKCAQCEERETAFAVAKAICANWKG